MGLNSHQGVYIFYSIPTTTSASAVLYKKLFHQYLIVTYEDRKATSYVALFTNILDIIPLNAFHVKGLELKLECEEEATVNGWIDELYNWLIHQNASSYSNSSRKDCNQELALSGVKPCHFASGAESKPHVRTCVHRMPPLDKQSGGE